MLVTRRCWASETYFLGRWPMLGVAKGRKGNWKWEKKQNNNELMWVGQRGKVRVTAVILHLQSKIGFPIFLCNDCPKHNRFPGFGSRLRRENFRRFCNNVKIPKDEIMKCSVFWLWSLGLTVTIWWATSWIVPSKKAPKWLYRWRRKRWTIFKNS